jgi:hypothetical protein
MIRESMKDKGQSKKAKVQSPEPADPRSVVCNRPYVKIGVVGLAVKPGEKLTRRALGISLQ